ncbi:MAG: hypothetical protein ACOCP8_08540, partial [archaeon]
NESKTFKSKEYISDKDIENRNKILKLCESITGYKKSITPTQGFIIYNKLNKNIQKIKKIIFDTYNEQNCNKENFSEKLLENVKTEIYKDKGYR